MADKFLDLMFTPKVLDAQRHYYGRAQTPFTDGGNDPLGRDEIDFIATRDSFYLSSVSETGWPYVQHRGGPPGFLKVIAPNELAFADYQGNRQMLSTGNVATNDRVCLFLMAYPHRTRLKILGHSSVVDAREHPELADHVADASMRQITERIFRIKVVSYDWNCPKYITPRYTLTEVNEAVEPLKQRIKELEAKLGL
jgi:predicted pyridoxine 5'-phosphate oxidase superfamily flavin-nucleotide-binding protein